MISARRPSGAGRCDRLPFCYTLDICCCREPRIHPRVLQGSPSNYLNSYLNYNCQEKPLSSVFGTRPERIHSEMHRQKDAARVANRRLIVRNWLHFNAIPSLRTACLFYVLFWQRLGVVCSILLSTFLMSVFALS